MKVVIVVIAFKRHFSLKRLLSSIEEAEVDYSVDLIISIECNATKKVIDVANNFSSKKFNKILIKHEKQLGLRNHVVLCGDLVKNYDGVIILEDDLLVDKYFYLYAVEALSFYNDSKSIAGIALYSHEYNEFANLPFRPMYNGFDTYPVQIPCSWGQCWTKDQWQNFKKWYIQSTKKSLDQIVGLPEQVKAWPESSWKKYFHAYMVEQDLYFMYPYVSFSTNCSDAGGTHIENESSLHQVCLPSQQRPRLNLSFCPTDYLEVKYDAFFEPNGTYIFRTLGIAEEDITVDLQGIKPRELILKKDFCITSKKVSNSMCVFSLRFKPIEFNLKFPSKQKYGLNLSKSNNLIYNENYNYKFEVYTYYINMSLINKYFILGFNLSVVKKVINRILFPK